MTNQKSLDKIKPTPVSREGEFYYPSNNGLGYLMLFFIIIGLLSPVIYFLL